MSNEKPTEVVALEPRGFLLYRAGVHRGHAEALGEMERNLLHAAEHYAQSNPEATAAEALLSLAAQLGQPAEAATAQSEAHLREATGARLLPQGPAVLESAHAGKQPAPPPPTGS